MASNFCDRCREMVWDPPLGIGMARHKCPPKFVVFENDDENDFRVVRAYDHAEAAEVYADQKDAEDAPYIINGDQITLRVRREGSDEKPRTFVVRGWLERHYSAEEKSEE